MKSLTTIILLLFAASPGHAAKSAIEGRWYRSDLSNDERNELVQRAKKETFEKIAPTLLKLLVDYQPIYAFGVGPSGGDTPWNIERLSARDRIHLMAGAVWQHHMSPRNDPAKAKAVLSLLRMATRPAEKSILIGVISDCQWCPDAEQQLLELSREAKESLDVRRLAAETLLNHCDLNTYMPIALEIIIAHKKGQPRCQAFNHTTNQGNRLFKLSGSNRHAVLTAGFSILNELPDEEVQTGYFVARRLGYILEMTNEFAPDQQATRYQGEHGLKDEFFADTVKNAIEWYSKNKNEIQSN